MNRMGTKTPGGAKILPPRIDPVSIVGSEDAAAPHRPTFHAFNSSTAWRRYTTASATARAAPMAKPNVAELTTLNQKKVDQEFSPTPDGGAIIRRSTALIDPVTDPKMAAPSPPVLAAARSFAQRPSGDAGAMRDV